MLPPKAHIPINVLSQTVIVWSYYLPLDVDIRNLFRMRLASHVGVWPIVDRNWLALILYSRWRFLRWMFILIQAILKIKSTSRRSKSVNLGKVFVYSFNSIIQRGASLVAEKNEYSIHANASPSTICFSNKPTRPTICSRRFGLSTYIIRRFFLVTRNSVSSTLFSQLEPCINRNIVIILFF